MIKNKKILILGGNGFIGKSLLSKINHLENSISIVSRKKFLSKYKIITGDLINDCEKLKKLFLDFDIIFNCAGELQDEKEMKKLHIDSLTNIVEFLSTESLKEKKLNGYKLAVLEFLDLVKKEEYIDENSLKNPSNYYEKTKLASEQIIINSANEYFEYIIMRPSTIYGIGMKSNFIFRLSGYIKKNFFLYQFKRNII